jgi:hypothetical protein
MQWVWIVIACGSAAFAASWWVRARRATRRARSEELDGVRRLTEEDVTYLGEQIHRLEPEVDGQVLDDETRDGYRTAVDCYESARSAVSQISDVDEIRKVTETISTGRHALACVQARLAASPAPTQRVMCFFDPMHGPSTIDVLWSRPGHGPRRVPACAHDAARVADTLAPEIRMVKIGARTTPYWAAGSAFQPYTEGYFASAVNLSWAIHPAVSDAAAGTSAPGYMGTGVVGSSGHLDGGGFDGSGGGM